MSVHETPHLLYLGTEDGLQVVRVTETGLEHRGSGLDGNAVRTMSVAPDDPTDAFVGCGLRGRGLYRTTDGGETFESLGFEDTWVWGSKRHPTDPETVYVGTEPPMVHVSTDGGESFRALDGIEELPSRSEWTFFHEPFYAGHVHGIDVHPARPSFLVAGVEHGALVYSADRGETWQEALVGSDVHRVVIHPNHPERVFAATGSGLYRSENACREWTQIPALQDEYLHSIVFDHDAPDRMYVYAAGDGPSLYRSEDDGESWHPIGAELPEARPADNLGIHPADADVLVYAGDTDDGSVLFVSDDCGESWQRLGSELPKVWRLTVTQ